MFGTVVAIALTCSPNLLGAIADKDFTGEGFTLTQRAKASKKGRTFVFALQDSKGETKWSSTEPSPIEGQPVFSADGWVALQGNDFEVLLFAPSGARSLVRLHAQLSAAEEGLVPRTNCGLRWLAGQRFEAGALVVEVAQRDAAPLTFGVTLSKTPAVARR
ncbi:MAG: hypothetical protein JNM69_20635 [Archangium sp.]|nr:hypothetical protein [Archangium sp.]